MHVAPIVVFVGLLVFLAHLFTGIFSRTKIPDVLLLILIGLCVGPGLQLVSPSDFGAVGNVFTTITLVIILFEGGLELDFDVLRRSLRRTMQLTLLNFVATTVVVAVLAIYLAGLDLTRGFMLGSMVASISPAVVVPLVRHLSMKNSSKTILFMESALSDVLSIVVALAFIESYRFGAVRFGPMIGHIISSFLLASLIGIGSGLIWGVILKRIRTLKNTMFTTPAFVFVVYGLVELLGFSGYIAALAFGATLGNIEAFGMKIIRRYIPDEPPRFTDNEKVFFSEIVFLLKTFFFVYVGLVIQFTDAWWVLIAGLLTAAIFVMRIPVVRFAIPKRTPRSDVSLMAIMTPKGLAAAVLAGIPLQQGIVGGDFIQNVTYTIVLFSILLTAILIFLVLKTPFGRVYELFFTGFGAIPAKEVDAEFERQEEEMASLEEIFGESSQALPDQVDLHDDEDGPAHGAW